MITIGVFEFVLISLALINMVFGFINFSKKETMIADPMGWLVVIILVLRSIV